MFVVRIISFSLSSVVFAVMEPNYL